MITSLLCVILFALSVLGSAASATVIRSPTWRTTTWLVGKEDLVVTALGSRRSGRRMEVWKALIMLIVCAGLAVGSAAILVS